MVTSMYIFFEKYFHDYNLFIHFIHKFAGFLAEAVVHQIGLNGWKLAGCLIKSVVQFFSEGKFLGLTKYVNLKETLYVNGMQYEENAHLFCIWKILNF